MNYHENRAEWLANVMGWEETKPALSITGKRFFRGVVSGKIWHNDKPWNPEESMDDAMMLEAAMFERGWQLVFVRQVNGSIHVSFTHKDKHWKDQPPMTEEDNPALAICDAVYEAVKDE